MNRIDLIGKRFGRLTVIGPSHINKAEHACWLCRCDCGNETIVDGYNLGRLTKSCGCLKKEFFGTPKLPGGIAARNKAVYRHKIGAKQKNHEQALTDEQIIALHKENCYYCGAPPSNICSLPSGSYTYSGIDRVNNDKGYLIDNVVSCCSFCNKAKGKKSVEEFQEQYKRIQLYLNSIL